MKNKYHISSQVYDEFRELTDDEKWIGLKGEYTATPGFQFWNRQKNTGIKTFSINSTKKQQQQT